MKPRVVLVHGSAADRATWTIQLASPALRERLDLDAYDRRVDATTVEAHADDLAARIGAGPAIAVGSSFGAVVVLDCARRRPELLRGVVLCEPPLAPSDDAPPVPAGFHERLDEVAARDGGEAAAEVFLRTVLGDAAYEKMPRAFQQRAKAQWPNIRSDSGALAAYRVRYRELGAVRVPALLLGGERSAPYFRPTLEALARALPDARLEILPGAGHMMHAEASRGFADRLLAFVAAVALVALVACGGGKPAPREIGNVAPDAAPLGAAPAGCPATFAAATGACDPATATAACAYDEGSCYCGVEPYCGGAAPDPEWERSRPTTWQCARTPPAVRGDGCPGTPPEGACSDEGQQCGYGDCCVATYACQGGLWRQTDHSCPP